MQNILKHFSPLLHDYVKNILESCLAYCQWHIDYMSKRGYDKDDKVVFDIYMDIASAIQNDEEWIAEPLKRCRMVDLDILRGMAIYEQVYKQRFGR